MATEVLFSVRGALAAGLASGDARAESAVRDHWWRLLWATTLDPADPLDAAVSGCAFHNAGEHERLALARYIAQLAAQQSHVDASHVA